MVAATGGSTNGALHLPAMAHEAGIDFDLMQVAEIFKKTPYIADLKPGGQYVAKDMYEAGGVPMLLKTLLEGGYLHGDCLTVTGKTLAENLEEITFNPDQKVIYPVSNPITPTGGVVGLQGSLAPDGAIVKVAGMENCNLKAPHAVSTAKKTPLPLSRRKIIKPAMSSSSAMRAEGRPGHARNAVDDICDLWSGKWRQGGAHH